MKIVHWNTHHGGVGSDGKFNIQHILDWLIHFEPDHVSLNELEENDGYGHLDQLEFHRAGLETAQKRKWYAAFCQLNGGSKLQGIGVGLLSSASLDNIDRPNLYGDRPAMYAKASFGSFYTTHPDPNSANARNIQLSQQLAWHQNQPDPKVICGDFNAVPTSVEMAPWTVFYKDAWVEAKKLGTAKSFTTDGATKSHRIDYIFYHGLDIVSVEVPDTRVGGVFPSDHYPVVAVFK